MKWLTLLCPGSPPLCQSGPNTALTFKLRFTISCENDWLSKSCSFLLAIISLNFLVSSWRCIVSPALDDIPEYCWKCLALLPSLCDIKNCSSPFISTPTKSACAPLGPGITPTISL